MTNTAIGLTLFSSIRAQFWANIGIPYINFGYLQDKDSRLKKKKKSKKTRVKKVKTFR